MVNKPVIQSRHINVRHIKGVVQFTRTITVRGSDYYVKSQSVRQTVLTLLPEKLRDESRVVPLLTAPGYDRERVLIGSICTDYQLIPCWGKWLSR